jgi:pseudaminic acid cytidylyltransferase
VIVAIIPARGGSKRIPRKNIRDFKGWPMMQWPIQIAWSSVLFDEIIVSTDDDDVARLADALHCTVVRRSEDDGTKGTQEIAAEVLRMRTCDMACVIYPCSPMLTARDLQEAYAALREQPSLAFSMSVLADPLADAGMFYFGHRWAFVNGAPLIYPHTAMIPIPSTRGIDINTQEDWDRAETMFDNLRANEKR